MKITTTKPIIKYNGSHRGTDQNGMENPICHSIDYEYDMILHVKKRKITIRIAYTTYCSETYDYWCNEWNKFVYGKNMDSRMRILKYGYMNESLEHLHIGYDEIKPDFYDEDEEYGVDDTLRILSKNIRKKLTVKQLQQIVHCLHENAPSNSPSDINRYLGIDTDVIVARYYTGEISDIVEFVGGKPNGKHYIFHKNGKLKKEIDITTTERFNKIFGVMVTEVKRSGCDKVFSKNGNLLSIYDNTDKTRIEYHDDGAIKKIYKSGDIIANHGEYIELSPNGDIVEHYLNYYNEDDVDDELNGTTFHIKNNEDRLYARLKYNLPLISEKYLNGLLPNGYQR